MKKHWIRGVLLGVTMTLLLSGAVAMADSCEPPVSLLAFDTHTVGTLHLDISDQGNIEGPYWPCPGSCKDHTNWGCLAVGNAVATMRDGC